MTVAPRCGLPDPPSLCRGFPGFESPLSEPPSAYQVFVPFWTIFALPFNLFSLSASSLLVRPQMSSTQPSVSSPSPVHRFPPPPASFGTVSHTPLASLTFPRPSPPPPPPEAPSTFEERLAAVRRPSLLRPRDPMAHLDFPNLAEGPPACQPGYPARGYVDGHVPPSFWAAKSNPSHLCHVLPFYKI